MKALIFSEDKGILTQALSYFRGLMDVDGATVGSEDSEILKYGAKKVYVLGGNVQYDNVSKALEEILKNGAYDLFFAPSTVIGREIAGMVSEQLNWTVIPEVSSMEIKDGKVFTKRFFLGGKTVLEEESNAKAFTFTPGIIEPSEAEGTSEVESIALPDSLTETLETNKKQGEGANIESAKIIVSVGRGLGKKEGIASVEPLVKATGGELAGSRPVCMDYQWLSEERQVGLSGKKVKPKVYIALGISGQIQHIAGMRGSKTVIAVNKDKNAPIFEEADYGIVADLYQVVPMLVQALQS